MKSKTGGNQAKKLHVCDGLFGLIVAGISAAVSIVAIMTWIYMARNHVVADSGGPAFAANLGPIVNSLLGMALGALALVITGGSLWFSDRPFPKSFTIYHLFSVILLAPSAILFLALLAA